MTQAVHPTDRELEILKILWRDGEASVREVYEQMRPEAGIAQNTVQAFLRTMEEKGLVRHRTVGRTFIYSPVPEQGTTNRRLVSRLLDRVFDGAIDQLVDSALSLKQPSRDELARLEALIAQARQSQRESRHATKHESPGKPGTNNHGSTG